MNSEWTPLHQASPEEGALVDWITPSGDTVSGGKKGPGQLWFLPPDHSAYCYYKPICWRLSNSETER